MITGWAINFRNLSLKIESFSNVSFFFFFFLKVLIQIYHRPADRTSPLHDHDSFSGNYRKSKQQLRCTIDTKQQKETTEEAEATDHLLILKLRRRRRSPYRHSTYWVIDGGRARTVVDVDGGRLSSAGEECRVTVGCEYSTARALYELSALSE